MILASIEDDFREKVCAQTHIASEGLNRFRVFTPFLFNDGDHLSIVLKQERDRWMLSDEGHTYLSRDRVISIFMEDFQQFISEMVRICR
ncbi:MAG: DUF1828 domain-containing protein [Magnetococcales bacterium]|nr:DUF1828 domain-containing protein [Magnetococcales bacterium]